MDEFSVFATLLTTIFSPNFCTNFSLLSSIPLLSNSSSELSGFPIKVWRVSLVKDTKESSLATKSVSQLTSIMKMSCAVLSIAIKPSAADLPDFLLAFTPLVFLSSSIANSISPLAPSRAFLQSIKPRPVFSLNSLTCEAEIALIFNPLPFLLLYLHQKLMLLKLAL